MLIKKPSPTFNSSRLLLSYLRGGDYTHAGEEEAIDIIVEKSLSFVPTITSYPGLDVGCGLGGTAHYLYQKGFKFIQGLDSDSAAIAYAKHNYPSIPFTSVDALLALQIYPPAYFGFICLFNVAYAIENKTALFEALSSVAQPGAIAVFFDYTYGQNSRNLSMIDLANKPMHPISLENMKTELSKADWDILEAVDMSADYRRWYRALLGKLTSKVEMLREHFCEADIQKVSKTFMILLDQLENGELGGAAVYAKKRVEYMKIEQKREVLDKKVIGLEKRII